MFLGLLGRCSDKKAPGRGRMYTEDAPYFYKGRSRCRQLPTDILQPKQTKQHPQKNLRARTVRHLREGRAEKRLCKRAGRKRTQRRHLHCSTTGEGTTGIKKEICLRGYA